MNKAIPHDREIMVGIAQMDPQLGQVENNLNRCLELLKEASQKALELVVFPECALTGYNFPHQAEALAISPPMPGLADEALASACRRYGIYSVVGSLERDGERLYNSALLIGPGGIVGKYRKTHLPHLGADRFVEPGDLGLNAFQTEIGSVGILICFDIRLPEPCRVLALQGADVIALPTNWPTGAEANTHFIVRARAAENRVHVLAADRVGEERGTRFIGRSQIVDVAGQVLSEGSEDGEEWISSRINPSQARTKRLVNRPGQYELDFWESRRPDLYDRIIRPGSAR